MTLTHDIAEHSESLTRHRDEALVRQQSLADQTDICTASLQANANAPYHANACRSFPKTAMLNTDARLFRARTHYVSRTRNRQPFGSEPG